MAAEKTKLGITRFFGTYFKGFPKIILTNLIFSIPFAVCFGVVYFLGELLSFRNPLLLTAFVIPLFPFFAGVTLVTRNLVREDEYVPVFQTFLRGIKENWLKFLFHGVVLYFAVLLSYFSIAFYYSFAQNNAFFYAIMVLCIIISIGFLFIFFNLPVMTVTFDLSLKDLYKNAALMAFGELKSNFLAALGVFLLGIFCASFLIFSGTSLTVVILTLIFTAVLVPATMSFIINFAVYKGMYTLLTAKEEKKEKLEKEMLYKKNPALKKKEEAEKLKEDFSDVVLDDVGDGDEYIFHNGKMVKRSVLMRQLNENGGQADEKGKKE